MTGFTCRALALLMAGLPLAAAGISPATAQSSMQATQSSQPIQLAQATGEDSTAQAADAPALSLPSWLPSWFPFRSTQPARPPGDPAAGATTAGQPGAEARGGAAGRGTAAGERPSLVALLEPLWIDLTPGQKQALAPFAPEWNTWPTADKKSWVALADKLPSMSPDSRAKAQRRILEWANLSPAQRRLARENYRLAKERPADQRVTEWEKYQSLTQEQRTVLREAGTTSNTAAGHAGAANGLAKEASQPLPRVTVVPPAGSVGFVPASSPSR